MSLYTGFGFWLFLHPVSISGDDALFFSKGIERFSILEFRPHFPGYPAFILLGKFFHFLGMDPLRALSSLSLLSVIAIPVLTALTIENNRLPLFLFALTMPLLPLLGLGMLSDGCGIAFFMAALWQYRKGHMSRCGGFMGLVLACRPSFLIPVAVFMVYEMIRQRGAYRLTVACMGVCIFFFGALLLIEGTSFLWEGWRFVEGHFFVWGNTTISEVEQSRSWLSSLFSYQGGVFLFGAVAGLSVYGLWRRQYSAAFVLCCAAWGWTLLFQNPENLRHLALPILLTGVFAGGRYVLMGTSLIQLLVFIFYAQFPFNIAPLMQAARYIETQDERTVMTNYGVATLREQLPQHYILDAYYEHYRPEGYLKLTTMPARDSIVFKGRVFGEKTFYLYQEN